MGVPSSICDRIDIVSLVTTVCFVGSIFETVLDGIGAEEDAAFDKWVMAEDLVHVSVLWEVCILIDLEPPGVRELHKFL